MKANYVTGKQAARAAGRAVADKLAREAVDRELSRQTAENGRMLDTVLAWVLHTEFGFGQRRITRVLRSFVDNYTHARERYGWDCVETKYAMELRRCGVDMDEIEREINEYIDAKEA